MTDTLLLNDFYTVTNKQLVNEHTFSCEILLNAEHGIFKGHFEQMPVVPGMCQTQMIKELLQEELGINLWMPKGDNIKFTGMIVPTQHPRVFADINYKLLDNDYVVDAKIYFDNIVFTKFKGTFKPLSHGSN